jgi:hypothetical protein
MIAVMERIRREPMPPEAISSTKDFAGDSGEFQCPRSPRPVPLKRCPWPKDDPLYLAYHDEERGVPEFDDRATAELPSQNFCDPESFFG